MDPSRLSLTWARCERAYHCGTTRIDGAEPGPDQTASLLEIGIAEAEGIEFIVHAMPARPKFLEA